MTALVFRVVGHAQPAGSKRHVGNGCLIDANPKAGDWKKDVGRIAAEAMAEAEHAELWDGPLGMVLLFSMQRPKGHFGTGRNAGVLKPSAPPYPTAKPDSTKLLRGVEDALTGVVFRDDAQVVEQTVMKRYATPEGVEVRVWTL